MRGWSRKEPGGIGRSRWSRKETVDSKGVERSWVESKGIGCQVESSGSKVESKVGWIRESEVGWNRVAGELGGVGSWVGLKAWGRWVESEGEVQSI